MKFYLIQSTEYKANEPSRFIMDENGKYYGCQGVDGCYARIHNYPANPEYWKTATCADADRYFSVWEKELTIEDVQKFDELTAEYIRLDEETPSFAEPHPGSHRDDYKSKKIYEAAVNEWLERYMTWQKESGIAEYTTRRQAVNKERTELFIELREK